MGWGEKQDSHAMRAWEQGGKERRANESYESENRRRAAAGRGEKLAAQQHRKEKRKETRETGEPLKKMGRP